MGGRESETTAPGVCCCSGAGLPPVSALPSPDIAAAPRPGAGVCGAREGQTPTAWRVSPGAGQHRGQSASSERGWGGEGETSRALFRPRTRALGSEPLLLGILPAHRQPASHSCGTPGSPRGRPRSGEHKAEFHRAPVPNTWDVDRPIEAHTGAGHAGEGNLRWVPSFLRGLEAVDVLPGPSGSLAGGLSDCT